MRSDNCGGDRYFTDGEIAIALFSPNNLRLDRIPIQALNPPTIQAKHQLWQWLKGNKIGLSTGCSSPHPGRSISASQVTNENAKICKYLGKGNI